MITPGAGALPALLDILSFLSSAKEAEEDLVWARVLDKLAAALDCEAATYFVFLPKQGQLIARAALGSAGHRVESRRVVSGEGLCGWVAKYREPVLTDDAYSDKRFLRKVDEETGYKTSHVLGVPLLDRLELSGVIELINKRSGPFTEADLAFVQAATQACALALRALRLETTVDKVTAHNASILENLGGGFVAVDVHGRVMLCNPAAKKILGLSEDTPMNQPVDQTLEQIPAMAEILMDTLVKKTTVKRQDLAWKSKAGARLLGYSTLLIQDPHGQVVGAGITFQDITQFQQKA
ncbi:MAG: GAF domain-containing protein [Elusimicrobiota bacterium]|nr:MAG: GAF domain-containing protein [Elusimicrobiota bacterium]